jgi:CubicO group peptidase (beta-lactamase class C family)
MDIAQLEQLIFDKMAESSLPGLSVALVREGEVAYARGFGLRDLSRGLPATPDTLYGIGSVTKSFTALAVLKLAEEGKLSLEDPVEAHLPFPYRPKGETVRLKHLLSHTTGLPALAYGEAIIRHTNGIGGKYLPIGGPEDILTFMQGAQEWAVAAPGERWLYFNEGYAILGLIIERLSGMPYAEYIETTFLKPLGMARSGFSPQLLDDADAAVPYVLAVGQPPREGRYLFRAIRSEGGLLSSVLELCRYLRLYLEGGVGIVTPESLRAMMTPQVALPLEANPLWKGSQGHYGYGLSIQELYGERLVGHGGSVLVSTAHLAFIPERKLGVALLANGSGYPLAQLAQLAMAHLLGRDPAELPFMHAEAVLAPLIGRYETFKGTMQAQVSRQGDCLELEVIDSAQPQRILLIPDQIGEQQAHFVAYSGGARLPVTFDRDSQGVTLLYERYALRRVLS